MKRLKHPNIVSYVGTERTEGMLNIFMEFVPGGSIYSLLQKFGSFSEKVIRVYTRQILCGLEYLHKNQIMHRDVKAGPHTDMFSASLRCLTAVVSLTSTMAK